MKQTAQSTIKVWNANWMGGNWTKVNLKLKNVYAYFVVYTFEKFWFDLKNFSVVNKICFYSWLALISGRASALHVPAWNSWHERTTGTILDHISAPSALVHSFTAFAALTIALSGIFGYILSIFRCPKTCWPSPNTEGTCVRSMQVGAAANRSHKPVCTSWT